MGVAGRPGGHRALGRRVGPDRVAVVRGRVGRLGAGLPARAPLAGGGRRGDDRRHLDDRSRGARSACLHGQRLVRAVARPGARSEYLNPQDPSGIPRSRFDPASSRRSRSSWRWSSSRCSHGATRPGTRSVRRSAPSTSARMTALVGARPTGRRRPRRGDAAAAAARRLLDTAHALPRRLENAGFGLALAVVAAVLLGGTGPGGWLLLGVVQLSVVGPAVLGLVVRRGRRPAGHRGARHRRRRPGRGRPTCDDRDRQARPGGRSRRGVSPRTGRRGRPSAGVTPGPRRGPARPGR